MNNYLYNFLLALHGRGQTENNSQRYYSEDFTKLSSFSIPS